MEQVATTEHHTHSISSLSAVPPAGLSPMPGGVTRILSMGAEYSVACLCWQVHPVGFPGSQTYFFLPLLCSTNPHSSH